MIMPNDTDMFKNEKVNQKQYVIHNKKILHLRELLYLAKVYVYGNLKYKHGLH